MPRRGGSSTERQAPQLVLKDNLPPPSTIAAQIVQNANKVHQQKEGKLPPFIDQVRAFLAKPNLEDEDDVCIAFAVTITNGGIDPLLNVDPFGRDGLEEQGDVCLAGLKVIFEQKPYLLLDSEPTADVDGFPRPPLFVRLLPKLLSLLAQIDLVRIHQSVQDLLSSCLGAMARSRDTMYQASALLRMYRSCVEGECLFARFL